MPVTGSKRENPKDLLKRIMDKVSEHEIYRFYLGRDFTIGVTTHSPFRKDENPSFSIVATKLDNLHHTDFADSHKNGGCIDFVMQLHSLDFADAVRKVAHDFCIGTQDSIVKGKVREGSPDCREQKPRESTFIQVKTRKFTHEELSYWADYGITQQDLKDNDIYAIKKLFLNKNEFSLPTDLIFGYFFRDIERWKIYRPLAPDKKNKWMTNVPNKTVSGISKMVKGTGIGIITKSKKDEIVISKIIPATCSVQNESEFSLTKSNMDLLQENCKELYLNFDADEVGVQASKYYNQFGLKWINCPRGYKKPDGSYIKDFADLAKYHGMDAVINHFKLKKLI